MSSSFTDAPSILMALTSAFAAPLPSAMSGQSFCPFAARPIASHASALSISPSGNSTERLRSFALSASTAAHSSMRSRKPVTPWISISFDDRASKWVNPACAHRGLVRPHKIVQCLR